MKIAILSIVTGFLISLIISPLIIFVIEKLKGQQSILSYVKVHSEKEGTLTLGGLIFIITGVICYFIFMKNNHVIASICLLSFIGFGLIGLLDDGIKIVFKHNEGLKPYQKIIGQFGISTIIAFYIYFSQLISNTVFVPIINIELDLGLWIIPFVIIFFIAVVNSVNLIDGMDGLAGGVTSVIILCIMCVLLIYENNTMGNYITAYKTNEILNVINLCGGILGGILAFLILNSYPAKIFMGDTGSLSLGGLVASVLALTNTYLIIFLVGIMLVLTVLSVVLQVTFYKMTRKRIFKMAPLHHHFQENGSNETKIVAIYILITIIFCFLTILIYL